MLPYLALTPLRQEIVKIRGRLRVTYFEELDKEFLNTAVRKMIVFPHGIYTITYKRRGRKAGQRAGQASPGELGEKGKFAIKKGTSNSACTPCAQSGSDGI